jgi:hypothetical protein
MRKGWWYKVQDIVRLIEFAAIIVAILYFIIIVVLRIDLKEGLCEFKEDFINEFREFKHILFRS